ncbi:MAG: FtsX-like permease family protein [Luteitalea sp.]|nr:FtsX-like permease family protein [Luteitalea sp.]
MRRRTRAERSASFRWTSITRRYTARRTLVLMLGAVGLVLFIACANVASVLLARAVTRRRECVIRAALGATRARLVRQLLVETGLLFLIGGAVGALIARLSVHTLVAVAIAGGYVPERMAVAVDGRVLGFSLLISLVTAAVFGLVPALQASRVDLNEGLRDSNHALSGGDRPNRARRLLIVSEVALSLVLLIGFGLMIRSLLRLHAVSSGFDPENVVQTVSDGGRSFPEAVAFWRTALEGARAMPGVELAAVTSRPPLQPARGQRFVVEGRPSIVEGEEPAAGDILISADYFHTMRIPFIRGRAFTEKDDETAAPVVIISQSLARRYFAHEDPVGKRVMLKERSPMSCCSAPRPVEGVWREIVGVVGNVRQDNLEADPAVTIYRPYSQIVEHDMFLMVRARSAPDAARVAAHIRSHLLRLDRSRDWWDVQPLRQVIHESESIRTRRFVLILLGSFAALGLVLAGVGIYGVTACTVAERTREIGVRMALGATRRVVFTQVIGETMILAVAGLVLGSVAALALTRFIASMLFEISSSDAVTYLGVSLLLASFALLAGYVPARRATQVDPIATLRHE